MKIILVLTLFAFLGRESNSLPTDVNSQSKLDEILKDADPNENSIDDHHNDFDISNAEYSTVIPEYDITTEGTTEATPENVEVKDKNINIQENVEKSTENVPPVEDLIKTDISSKDISKNTSISQIEITPNNQNENEDSNALENLNTPSLNLELPIIEDDDTNNVDEENYESPEIVEDNVMVLIEEMDPRPIYPEETDIIISLDDLDTNNDNGDKFDEEMPIEDTSVVGDVMENIPEEDLINIDLSVNEPEIVDDIIVVSDTPEDINLDDTVLDADEQVIDLDDTNQDDTDIDVYFNNEGEIDIQVNNNDDMPTSQLTQDVVDEPLEDLYRISEPAQIEINSQPLDKTVILTSLVPPENDVPFLISEEEEQKEIFFPTEASELGMELPVLVQETDSSPGENNEHREEAYLINAAIASAIPNSNRNQQMDDELVNLDDSIDNGDDILLINDNEDIPIIVDIVNGDEPTPIFDVNGDEPMPMFVVNGNEPQPMFDVNGNEPMPMFDINGDEPRPMFEVNGNGPQPMFDGNGNEPMPMFVVNGNEPITMFDANGDEPKPMFEVNGNGPQPMFDVNGNEPMPMFDINGDEPRPMFDVNGNEPVQMFDVNDDGEHPNLLNTDNLSNNDENMGPFLDNPQPFLDNEPVEIPFSYLPPMPAMKPMNDLSMSPLPPMHMFNINGQEIIEDSQLANENINTMIRSDDQQPIVEDIIVIESLDDEAPSDNINMSSDDPEDDSTDLKLKRPMHKRPYRPIYSPFRNPVSDLIDDIDYHFNRPTLADFILGNYRSRHYYRHRNPNRRYFNPYWHPRIIHPFNF